MMLRSFAAFFATTWNIVRSLSTDDAYERYLSHHMVAHSGSRPLSRRAFYMRQQQEKWTGVSRCC
jgi:uncharacterized short protein YbdD (DUF466 family)